VLETAGHDVIWSGDWPEDPGDEEILAQAHREGRTGAIITASAHKLRIRPPDK
jgi:predicted nuclease of predicted toxin-antitoxin system